MEYTLVSTQIAKLAFCIVAVHSQARKSMVYASHLVQAGDNFIEHQLGGFDNYISVHWRRGDYVELHPGESVLLSFIIMI